MVGEPPPRAIWSWWPGLACADRFHKRRCSAAPHRRPQRGRPASCRRDDAGPGPRSWRDHIGRYKRATANPRSRQRRPTVAALTSGLHVPVTLDRLHVTAECGVQIPAQVIEFHRRQQTSPSNEFGRMLRRPPQRMNFSHRRIISRHRQKLASLDTVQHVAAVFEQIANADVSHESTVIADETVRSLEFHDGAHTVVGEELSLWQRPIFPDDRDGAVDFTPPADAGRPGRGRDPVRLLTLRVGRALGASAAYPLPLSPRGFAATGSLSPGVTTSATAP